MSTTTTAAQNSTANATMTTPPPASSSAPFCFSCGFDFGHVMDGVDDRTAGALVVVLVLMVLLALSVLIACFTHDWCCGAGGYRRVGKASKDAEEGPNEDSDKN